MVTIVLIEVVIFIMVSGLHPGMKSLLVVGSTGSENFQGQRIHSFTNLLDDHFSVSKGLCENAYQDDDVQGSMRVQRTEEGGGSTSRLNTIVKITAYSH